MNAVLASGRLAGLAFTVLAAASAALAGPVRAPSLAAAPDLAQPAQLSTEERAAELRRLHADLNAEDPFLRRAAFEIAAQSEDPLVLKFAIDAALDSDDADLRTDGLRKWLSQRERLSLELELPANPSAEQRKLYEEMQPLWFEVQNIGHSELTLLRRGNRGLNFQGSFVPGGFRVDYRDCRLELSVIDRRQLAGAFSCGTAARLLATVDVQ